MFDVKSEQCDISRITRDQPCQSRVAKRLCLSRAHRARTISICGITHRREIRRDSPDVGYASRFARTASARARSARGERARRRSRSSSSAARLVAVSISVSENISRISRASVTFYLCARPCVAWCLGDEAGAKIKISERCVRDGSSGRELRDGARGRARFRRGAEEGVPRGIPSVECE